MSREGSQSLKPTYCMIPFIYEMTGIGNYWTVTANGCEVGFWGGENVLHLGSGDGCMTAYTETIDTYFKWVSFMVCDCI